MNVTNNYGVNLLMAVWLLNDDYDHDHRKNVISASSLIKPLKKFILSKRVDSKTKQVDVADLMASGLGSSIHDAIEAVWLDPIKRGKALTKLGIPEHVQKSILVNPTQEQLYDGCIPLYFEQRVERTFGDYIITGKYDAVADGRVNDTKSTGVFSYMKGNKDQDYINQLSIYKWLNPEIVTDPIGQINFAFTDWQGFMASRNADYPEKRLISKTFVLLPDTQVEALIKKRLDDLNKYMDALEEDIPECTKEDLWMDPPVYKYYADPSKVAAGGRSTKNYSDPQEAVARQIKEGKGVVVPVLGAPKACGYCDAYEICKQKDRYEHV
jgi:hypothetical protein